jgi:hypothetical protein
MLLTRIKRDVRPITYKALVEGCKNLQESTRRRLRAAPFKSNNMTKGVRYYVNPDTLEANVNIMGHPLLRIFEKGTPLRKTKKGYNRGKIKQYAFFYDARSKMRGILNTIYRVVDREMIKLDK